MNFLINLSTKILIIACNIKPSSVFVFTNKTVHKIKIK